MAEDARVVTASLPNDLVLQMNEVAHLIDRSKSWIVREAVRDWLAEWQRRHELTLEALKDVDEGRTYTQEEAELLIAQRRLERRKA